MRSIEPAHLSDEELVAYADGEATDDRRLRAEAHLAGCAPCRARVAESVEVARLLRRRYPLVRDPAAWGAFSARLTAAERRRGWAPRAALAAAALALLLVTAFSFADQPATLVPDRVTRLAMDGVRRVVPGKDEPVPVRRIAASVPGVGAPPFRAVVPSRLPLGLVQVERSTPAVDRLELLYRNDAGLAVLLAESPADGAPPAVPSGLAGFVTVSVGGTDVLVISDPRPQAVAGMLWNRRGVRFELLVTEAPGGGLLMADAERLVEVLTAAQDSIP